MNPIRICTTILNLTNSIAKKIRRFKYKLFRKKRKKWKKADGFKQLSSQFQL